nr:T7-like capsid assembly protein [uncultured Mediterranean phage uvMED]
MAETLTFDNSTESEVLSPDEQESLEIGQQMRADQEQLLAGKYNSVEELEKGYLEAQKQLGKGTDDEEVEEVEEETQEYEPTETSELISEASAEWYESGELSQDTIDKFASMDSTDLVNAYLEMQAAAPEAEEAPDLTQSDVDSLFAEVGGQAQYEEITEWAAQSLSEGESDAFNQVIENGSLDQIKLMMAGLQARYTNENGYEGVQLQGKPPSNSRDVFRSQQEVVDAISDPRYDRDEAYRQDVLEKLERSDVSFR